MALVEFNEDDRNSPLLSHSAMLPPPSSPKPAHKTASPIIEIYFVLYLQPHSSSSKQVPPFLVRKVFTQIFSFINGQLFNSLLLRRECCSFSNDEYVKAGLAELEHWCYKATDEYAGTTWDELKHIRQAIGFLVTSMKTSSNGWK